jgi:hypothetical protein
MGFKPKTIYHQTVDIVIANSLTVVQITKNLVKEERPDGSNNLSFPSGHTAIALPPPYSFKNTKILTCGMPVVGLYLQATAILRIASIIHLMYSRSRNWITVNFSD